jgi:hypothetical protein
VFEAGLAGYLDGEAKPEIATHSSDCVSCGVLLNDLKWLVAQSGELRDQDPPARLWNNIRAALAAEGLLKNEVSFWDRWFPVGTWRLRAVPVAALCALALLSMVIVAPSRPSNSESTASKAVASAGIGAALGTVPVDTKLVRTVQELQTIYQARAASFGPGVNATYQRGLKSLDDSIKECQDSVHREPGNTLAREYLTSAYQEKAEILQSALEFDNGQ